MTDANEILETCMSLLDLDVPGPAVAPILRWVADQLEQPAEREITAALEEVTQ